ncbi:PAS domain S-box protein [Fulvivirga sp. RKSG066]|uniref:PAS domain S-box protein n=1 Tax=Fulvivirga aurantia TaxID=2529383 RepID=UPI0012BD277A|nr:PAS domain S-box protein [Fulvivirga aurantia]MTI23283.1 PAS domain S-box protein [Fulvivirga aurantia]
MDDLGVDRYVLSDFVANSAEAICIFDANQKVLDWNAQMIKTTGIEASLAIARDLQDVIADTSLEPIQKCIKRALAGKSTVCEHVIAIHPENSRKYFKPSFTLVRGAEPVLIAIFREVKQELLKTAESRFKPLIEKSPIATAIYNPCGRPRYFNKAYGAIWGAESGTGELAIRDYNILQDEQLVELGIMPFIQKAFAGESCEIPPVPYTPAKTHSIKHLGLGDQRYVKGHIFPIKDAQNEIDEVVLVLTDVTYHKKAEQILTDTHLKFQMLTIGLPGVIYEYLVKNGNSKFKYISEGCEEMFGVTPEEVVSDSDLLLKKIHPEDLQSFIDSSQESDKDFKGWHWEGRIVVDGEVKWIEGKSSPAKTKKGHLVRYGLLLDITDKKQVEAQYKITEERLQLALQGAEIGIWEWDTKKRKTIFNQAWSKNFGYNPSELEKKFEDWAKRIHPEDLSGVYRKFNQHLAGETEFFEAEYRFLTKKGDYRWILDKGRAVQRDAKGNVTKAAGTYLDINDIKNSELLIKRNEQLFTQLFENSPLGIVMLDEKHKVLQMNKGFENIFGFSKREIVGNRLNDIIVPKELGKEAMDINMLTTSGKVGMLESYRVNKSGVEIPVLIYGVPVSLDNETIGIYGIYVDITDRKRAEHELQIRNNELDNFVYKVSHDLRAPLSSILGLVHLANHEQNEDDIREYITIIESRVQQLDNFINDVLSHSKNLKLALSVEPIDFKSVVESCFEDLSYLPKASLIRKEINIDERVFYSDRWRINEIFRNLISNAIKYLNTEIDNPFVKIDIKVTDARATIILEDNGIGIEKDTLPKVFEMFFRATEYSEGSGIGLYIVKNAVEKLGGKVTVKSQPSVGTTFKLTIPNSKEAFLNMSK